MIESVMNPVEEYVSHTYDSSLLHNELCHESLGRVKCEECVATRKCVNMRY